MDSAWPMHGHDVRHTGRSPYTTANNPGEEKWWFKLDSFIEGSPVIDNDGVIFFGSWDNHLYAINPNGTLKWMYDIKGNVETSPAIAEDGTIYVGTHFALEGNYLYAVNPNGTLKWRYKTGNMYSSPAIEEDGTIYCSDGGNSIMALYPNGTLKWKYTTGGSVMSSPAIDDDGIVYCGSHDDHVYALYPNGTLKWKFNTGSWVHGFPTIGDDGTVYINSDNGYMYALYPNNGTMKWRCKIGAVWGNPALDKDGNLYVGVWEKKFYAIYPNGIIKWSVNLSRRVWGMSAVISDDGTIYFGTCDFEGHDGGHLHALNPDGTIKFILYHTRMFWASPAIGDDGTIYICTRQDEYKGGGYVAQGRLRALSDLDPDAPEEPTISGSTGGKVGKEYEYTFKSTSPLGKDVYYYVDWGDLMNTGWLGPYGSGEEVKLKHSWRYADVFTIRVKAKDIEDLWGPWGELTVTMPRNRAYAKK
jgi:outer membrane protein assembly factor BamB